MRTHNSKQDKKRVNFGIEGRGSATGETENKMHNNSQYNEINMDFLHCVASFGNNWKMLVLILISLTLACHIIIGSLGILYILHGIGWK